MEGNQLLNQQADAIEQVLGQFRLPVRVEGGTVSSRFVRFNLSPAPGTKLNRVAGLSEEIAMALGAESVRVERRMGTLEVQVPRPSFRPLTLKKLRSRIAPVPPDTVLIGMDDDGHPLLVRLTSPDVAHVLIAGTTGSGKTALMRTIGAGLTWDHAPKDWGLVLIDPKGRGLQPLTGWPHVLAQTLGESHAHMLDLLQWTVSEMERRDREGIARPRLALLIDEVADLVLTVGKPAVEALARLTGRGREAGVHVIASTQKPNSSAIGSLAKANFPLRLVGRVLSPEESKIATGIKGAGAEKLLGRGDFMAVTVGRTVRFQAAYVSANEIVQEVYHA